MHPVTIPDELIREVTKRRGRLHPFDRLAAATTALVTIDLQNAFMAPGAPLEVPVARAIAALRPGNSGCELWSELGVEPGEPIVDKLRYSAFIQWSSNIDALLRARGIETIVIAGTISNVCCESSARDAMMLGYNVVFVSDATAALSDAAHLSALCSIFTVFGDVMTTRDTIAGLRGRTTSFASDKNPS